MAALTTRFSTEQIQKIKSEGMVYVYVCACPAQVADQISKLRNLYAYQQQCLNSGTDQRTVHERIAEATREAHALMEQCLADVLALEGWDPETLEMPPGLRQKRDRQLNQE
jgi:5-deoxy-D-glucuronate isomerase